MPSFASDPDAALAYYLEFGYLIEPNIRRPGECETLRRASEQLPSCLDGTFAPAISPHRIDPVFLAALRNPRLVQIMEILLSGRVSGLQSEFFFCRPGTPGFSMHQDNYFVEAKSGVFASAWTPLQDVSPEMGSVIVYPGSHREPILPVVATGRERDAGQDMNAYRQEAVLQPGYEAVHLSVPLGAAVLMHGHLVHASNQNRTNRFRRALVTTYIRSGEYFRPGFTARRTEVDLYS